MQSTVGHLYAFYLNDYFYLYDQVVIMNPKKLRGKLSNKIKDNGNLNKRCKKGEGNVWRT
jgi:hypothetical protein